MAIFHSYVKLPGGNHLESSGRDLRGNRWVGIHEIHDDPLKKKHITPLKKKKNTLRKPRENLGPRSPTGAKFSPISLMGKNIPWNPMGY